MAATISGLYGWLAMVSKILRLTIWLTTKMASDGGWWRRYS